MPESILNETKAAVNIADADTAFDIEIKMHINSAFSTLLQIGIGPEEGFRITGDSEVWTDFLPEGPMLDKVKEYLGMRVRYRFDQPGTGYHTTALKELILEEEVRLSIMREDVSWVPPDPPVDPEFPDDPLLPDFED